MTKKILLLTAIGILGALTIGMKGSKEAALFSKRVYVVAKDYQNQKVKTKTLEELTAGLGDHTHKGRSHKAYYWSKDEVQNKTFPEGLLVEELKTFRIVTGCSKEPPTLPPPELDPDFQTVDWGILRVGSDQVLAQEDADQIAVCVVDTGIDTQHNDVKAWKGENFTSSNSAAYHDGNGHGTHTAGLVAAINNKFGVLGASQAKLIIAKALDDDGSGYNSWIADAVDYCVDSGAHIISMSLGGPTPSTLLENSLKRATSRGIWVFAAAGNDGSTSVGYPAGYVMPGLYSISAIDQFDNLAWFSNWGKVEFTCPGVNILSTVPPNSYDRYSGTSMATPICAGVAALFKARNKPLTARPLGDPLKFGAGILYAPDVLR